MQTFFKPTKIKIITTILLFILSILFYAYLTSYFVVTLINWCIPSIPGEPAPTPEPVSISRAFSDVPRLENPLPLGNYGDVLCMSDPSAQLAGHIVDISKIIAVIVYVFFLYLVVCALFFLVTNSKKQKLQTGKSKK